jgi:hypothetical protein
MNYSASHGLRININNIHFNCWMPKRTIHKPTKISIIFTILQGFPVIYFEKNKFEFVLYTFFIVEDAAWLNSFFLSAKLRWE